MSRTNIAIRDVVGGNLCLGCGACASVQFGRSLMALSGDGFLRPASHASSVLDQEAAEICPGLTLALPQVDTNYHPLWGPVVATSTGYSTNVAIRFSGASGGVITAIATALIDSGKVAFVWQTKADPVDPLGNVSGASRTSSEVLEAAGSRYGPSNPLAGIEEALATGKVFAFVGKPCDVAGLHKLAQSDPRIARQVPYRLSFFCAGVPSRRGTEAVVRALDTELEEVRNFRYRGEGWPGKARVTRLDGTTQSMDYNSSWGMILNRHLQFRCKICPDGTGEFADIVCADAWYGKDGYPDFEERDGRSLIIARTASGDELVNELAGRGVIVSSSLAISEIEAMQPYQAYRKRTVLARRFALLAKGRLAPRYTGLGLSGLALRHSWLDLARNFLGTLSRLVKES